MTDGHFVRHIEDASPRHPDGPGSSRCRHLFAGFWLDVNNERNLPAWYSTLLLAVVALVASDVARVERTVRRTPWWAWAFLTATFLGLSFDELTQMHEKSSTVSAILLPLVIVFAAVTSPLVFTLPRRIAYQVVGAGALFVGGGVGAELIQRTLDGTNQFLVHMEETAEMFGVAILLAAIAQYREVLDDRLSPVRDDAQSRLLAA